MLHTLPAGFTQLEWFLGKGGGGSSFVSNVLLNDKSRNNTSTGFLVIQSP